MNIFNNQKTDITTTGFFLVKMYYRIFGLEGVKSIVADLQLVPFNHGFWSNFVPPPCN